jgi:hypothetical protein
VTPGESKQQEQGIVAYHQSIKNNFIIATETTASSILRIGTKLPQRF